LEDDNKNSFNNNDEIKKNLFTEFDKKDSFNLSSKFSFDNEKIEEDERVKKEEYYNKLINQINLFKNFNNYEKAEFKDNADMDIDYENFNDSIQKITEEGKDYNFIYHNILNILFLFYFIFLKYENIN
jgi:hypothetical protein